MRNNIIVKLALASALILSPVQGVLASSHEAAAPPPSAPEIPALPEIPDIPDVPEIPEIPNLPEDPVVPAELIPIVEEDTLDPSPEASGVISTLLQDSLPKVVQHRLNLNSFVQIGEEDSEFTVRLKSFDIPVEEVIKHWVISLDTASAASLYMTRDELTAANQSGENVAIEFRTNAGAFIIPANLVQALDATVTEVQITINGNAEEGISFRTTIIKGDQKIEINSFDAYVDREVTLEGKPNINTTTGVLVDVETGQVSFAPTVFFERNGKYYAKLQSRHNGVFKVLSAEKHFEDISNHWGEVEIKLLASKQIITGINDLDFAPNADINRAQFATLLIRALGEELSEVVTTSTFNDVSEKDWYSKMALLAAQYELIQGKSENQFAPAEEITRQEMVVMLERALKHVGVAFESASSSNLAFEDEGQVASWASSAVSFAVEAGITTGKTETTFAPLDNATRAEATTMIKRFLQYIQFINQ
jgi:hypothetical protein